MAEDSLQSQGVAGRYASALFDLAVEEGSVDEAAADMETVGALLSESADFTRLVRSPGFDKAEQIRATEAVFGAAGIRPLVTRFAKVVASNRRLFVLPDMVSAFARLVATHRGEVTAEVTSAEPLSDTHREALAAALSETSGKTVRLDTKVDPELIGGLIVRLGSRMIDTSLRTKLNGLRTAMKEAG